VKTEIDLFSPGMKGDGGIVRTGKRKDKGELGLGGGSWVSIVLYFRGNFSFSVRILPVCQKIPRGGSNNRPGRRGRGTASVCLRFSRSPGGLERDAVFLEGRGDRILWQKRAIAWGAVNI